LTPQYSSIEFPLSPLSTPTQAIHDDDWQHIRALLPPDLDQLAVKTKLTAGDHRADSSNARIKNVDMFLRPLFHWVSSGVSLMYTGAMASASGQVTISVPGLRKRFLRSKLFLSSLLELVLRPTFVLTPCSPLPMRVIAVDATSLTEPGGEGTDMRIHYAIELPSCIPVELLVTDEHGGETLLNFSPIKGALHLADRGYCSIRGLLHFILCQAFVLVRYNPHSICLFTTPVRRSYYAYTKERPKAWYRANHETLPLKECLPHKCYKFDILPELKDMVATQLPLKEFKVWLHELAHPPVELRLIVARIPEEVVQNEVLPRLRKEKSRELTPEEITRARFVMLLTNVPAEHLPCEAAVEVYSLRWQVELAIKRGKSIGGLDKFPCFTDELSRVWLLAHLLLQLLALLLLDFLPGEEELTLGAVRNLVLTAAKANLDKASNQNAFEEKVDHDCAELPHDDHTQPSPNGKGKHDSLNTSPVRAPSPTYDAAQQIHPRFSEHWLSFQFSWDNIKRVLMPISLSQMRSRFNVFVQYLQRHRPRKRQSEMVALFEKYSQLLRGTLLSTEYPKMAPNAST
jgi:hypothetical protein